MMSPDREPSSHALANPCFSQQRRVALELFAVRGFRHVSVRNLAKNLGLSPGAIYYHIESKEQLLFEFIEELYGALIANVSMSERELSPARRLRRTVELHVSLHEPMALHFQLLEKESVNLTDEFASQFEALREEYIQRVISVIQPWMRARDEDTVRARAQSVVTLLHLLPKCLKQANVTLLDPVEIMMPLIMRALCD